MNNGIKNEPDRKIMKSVIIEELLDGLDYDQLRSVYIFTRQKEAHPEDYDTRTAAFEISAESYSKEKMHDIEKIVRACFCMDAEMLRRLYVTALNMI